MSPPPQARDAAWTRVISLAPTSSPAWSNRGALRLQYGRWAQAEEDLRHAVLLEALPADERQQQQLQQRERERGDAAPLPASLLEQQPTAALEQVDASTLNNLGNAEVALGRLPQAMAHFQVGGCGTSGGQAGKRARAARPPRAPVLRLVSFQFPGGGARARDVGGGHGEPGAGGMRGRGR